MSVFAIQRLQILCKLHQNDIMSLSILKDGGKGSIFLKHAIKRQKSQKQEKNRTKMQKNVQKMPIFSSF